MMQAANGKLNPFHVFHARAEPLSTIRLTSNKSKDSLSVIRCGSEGLTPNSSILSSLSLGEFLGDSGKRLF